MASRLARTISIPLAAAATFVGVYVMTPPGRSDATETPPPYAASAPAPAPSAPTSVVQSILSTTYYRNCNEARAVGAAPIYRGRPGYRSEMDGDDDGIACEPYRGQ